MHMCSSQTSKSTVCVCVDPLQNVIYQLTELTFMHEDWHFMSHSHLVLYKCSIIVLNMYIGGTCIYNTYMYIHRVVVELKHFQFLLSFSTLVSISIPGTSGLANFAPPSGHGQLDSLSSFSTTFHFLSPLTYSDQLFHFHLRKSSIFNLPLFLVFISLSHLHLPSSSLPSSLSSPLPFPPDLLRHICMYFFVSLDDIFNLFLLFLSPLPLFPLPLSLPLYPLP